MRLRCLPSSLTPGNGTYGTAFHEALTEKVQLGKLLSYAGFLDMAIVTGTALSHGVARYAALQSGGVDTGMNRAWALTLADSVLKDFCYKNVVREDLIAYVRNDLGGNPDNFWQPVIDLEAVTADWRAAWKMPRRMSLRIWSTATSSPPCPPPKSMPSRAGGL